MDSITILVARIFIFITAQIVIAGAMTAFPVLSRMHEEKAFPGESRGRRILRLLHRERLHLLLVLFLLEALLIIVATVNLPGLFSGLLHPGGTNRITTGFIPALLSALAIAVSFIAGAGFATRKPRMVAVLVSYLVFPFFLLLKPLSVFLLKLVSIPFPDLPAEIALPLFLLPGSGEGSEGFIEKNGSMLVRSIVEFGEKKVREVMVPRIDVFAIDFQADIEDIREQVSEAGHSRVPIYDTSIDRILGILCVKDLVDTSCEDESDDIRRLVREPFFVPEGKKLEELLREFQMMKKHLAIVVDEYGGTSGIVTLEDILEEIVGEIRDEHDQEGPLVRAMGENIYSVEGRINLDELDELLDISLLSDDVDTLGGFIFDLLGRVPEEGEEIEYEGMEFRIDRLEGQRIAEVVVRLPGKEK
ncbi:MAG: hemolysin family protein [Bacteroidales bacterium]|nr:hemolysin family protein [Candidatus Latescibacterota bacterium]